MSDLRKSTRPSNLRTARAVLLGASLSTLAIAGAATSVQAQTATEQTCAFAMRLRSVVTVERLLEDYPNDACVPLMLSALAPELLSQIDPALVDALPASQQRLIPRTVRAQIGVAPQLGTQRTVTTTQRTRPTTTTTTTSSSQSQY